MRNRGLRTYTGTMGYRPLGRVDVGAARMRDKRDCTAVRDTSAQCRAMTGEIPL